MATRSFAKMRFAALRRPADCLTGSMLELTRAVPKNLSARANSNADTATR